MSNCNDFLNPVTNNITRTRVPITRSPSITRTNTSTPTQTKSMMPTATPTISVSRSHTSTTTNTKTPTNTSSVSKSHSQTPTNTPTLTKSVTATKTHTPTKTSSSTHTSTQTYTPTKTGSNTGTRTNTPTNTFTRTATFTPTQTWTPTQTFTPTRTQTRTQTQTRTPSTNSAICSGIIIDSGNNYTGSLTLDDSTTIISDINSQYNITDIQHNPGICNPRTLMLSGGGKDNSINNISSYNNANFNIFKSGVGSWLLGSGTYNGKLFVEQGELIINNDVLSSGAGPFGSSNLRPLIGTTGIGEEVIKSSLLLNAGYFINKGFDIISSSSDNNEIIIGGINSGQSVYSGIQIRSDRELTLSASTDNETVFFSDFKNSTGTQNASISLNIGSPTNDGIVKLASSGSLPDTITELNILNGKLILDFSSNNSLPPIKIGNNWIDETFNPTLDILNYEKFLYNLTFDSPHLSGIVVGESESLLKFFGQAPAISSVNSEFYQFINHEIYPDIRFIVDTIIDTQYGSSLTLYGDIDSYRPFYLPNPPGGIIKNGPGDLSLMGILSYSGSTTINDGSIFVNGYNNNIDYSVFTPNSLTVSFNTDPFEQTYKLLPGPTVFPGSFNININYPYLPTYDTSTSTLTISNCNERVIYVSGVYDDPIFMQTNIRFVADSNIPTRLYRTLYQASPCPFPSYPQNYRTLTLDGTSTEYNALGYVWWQGIPITVDIVKEGTGTWVFNRFNNWSGRSPGGNVFNPQWPYLFIKEGTVILAGNAAHGSGTGSIIGKRNGGMPVLGSTTSNNSVALLLAQVESWDVGGDTEIPIEERQGSNYGRTTLIPSGVTNSEIILGGSCYPSQTGVFGTFYSDATFRMGCEAITMACDPNGEVSFYTAYNNWQDVDGYPHPGFTLNFGTQTMTGAVSISRMPSSILEVNIRSGNVKIFLENAFGHNSSGSTIINLPPVTIGSSYSSAILTCGFLTTHSTRNQTLNDITFIGNNNIINGNSKLRLINFNNSDPIIAVQSGDHSISCPLRLESTTTIDVAQDCELTISGAIDPTGAALIKDGPGSLIIEQPALYTGSTNIMDGSLILNSIIDSPKVDSAIFTPNTLTVNFNSDPTTITNSFKLLSGSTVQNYTSENITIIGVTGTYSPTYNSLTSTLLLEGDLSTPTLLETITDIPGLIAYYTASSGVTYDENNVVSQWNDQSNNNNHAVASVNARPTYSASAIYNQPAIEFNGAGQVLSAINSPPSALPAVSAFIVYKRNGNGSGNDWMFMTTNITISVGLSVEANGGVFRMTGFVNGSDFNGQHITNDLDPHLAGMVISGSSTYTYLDGVESSNIGSIPVSTSVNQLHIGGYPGGYGSPAGPNGEFFNGQIAELILFNRALTTAERLRIETAIQQQYGSF